MELDNVNSTMKHLKKLSKPLTYCAYKKHTYHKMKNFPPRKTLLLYPTVGKLAKTTGISVACYY